jgi:hypothetical protein
MELKTAKKLLENDFLNALKYKIPEAMQNDSDFQVYACDSLNGLIGAAKEIDRLGKDKGNTIGMIVEEDKFASFMRQMKDAVNLYQSGHWNQDLDRLSEIIDQMADEIPKYESLARMIFVVAVDSARTDSLKLLFKMSATI